MSTVMLLGATGETGKELLKVLAASPTVKKIVTVGRRETEFGLTEGKEKVEQKIVSFDNIETHSADFANIDKGFCCLGTTRAKSGKEGFVKVDFDYVVKSAELLKSGGCDEFHLLSSQGSNPESWFLYMSTKGKAENAVKELNFSKYSIYRPGLLICPRSERRVGEQIMQWLARKTDWSHTWSVPTPILARAMFLHSEKSKDGVSILEHADIVGLGMQAST